MLAEMEIGRSVPLAVDQIDVECPHRQCEFPHPVEKRRVFGILTARSSHPRLALLYESQSRDRVLAHGLLILVARIGELLLHDFTHPHLRQLLGREFRVEHPALDRLLVLHECGHQLDKILAADALGLWAFRFRQSGV
ncbi:MAG TPA: hypothetical protein VHX65_06355 [Pirellulales bacterium]|nr:hypothetical protein [Pirellulales bacterium]